MLRQVLQGFLQHAEDTEADVFRHIVAPESFVERISDNHEDSAGVKRSTRLGAAPDAASNGASTRISKLTHNSRWVTEHSLTRYESSGKRHYMEALLVTQISSGNHRVIGKVAVSQKQTRPNSE